MKFIRNYMAFITTVTIQLSESKNPDKTLKELARNFSGFSEMEEL